ncbi:succinylglutamate desuccinylase/aspartoacylase family protein [Hyphobacterium marinum]|uniref:Succinylglutamate desuccinylase/aspartoacylase family protein n=1 Tax=Hyphobacterium marinum TaxID=3116574 RepID=A0ABU7LX74_9PROT|nr:succinylglutamate desuccinylase/aspartoacylase family protein [Hyphobacterium sp. Y6023]MEE2566071.1 succinylglutamate desuccinylase/aspartoacylase family protein [Hyphobacterium sp. Y6023]
MTRPDFLIARKAVAPGERRIVDIPVSVLSDHTPMALSAHVIHGRKDGPTAFISAAVHGDEIIGVEIIRRLINTPQMKSVRGTLICVPIVNTFGFINHTRYLPDRRDLNRSFPGASTGSLAARLARLFMKEIVSRSDIGIDLHSAAEHRTNLPQLRIDAGSKRVRELAEAFAPPVIVQSKLRDGSLRLAAREMGKDVLVYEAGEALRFDEAAIRLGVKGTLRVLHHVGMVGSAKGLTTTIRPLLSKRSGWERAPMGGLLRAWKAAGGLVEKGEVIAAIADPLGEKEEEVRASMSGLVIGRTVLPVVNEGDALFHIAEISRTPKTDPLVRIGEETEGDPLFDEDEIL